MSLKNVRGALMVMVVLGGVFAVAAQSSAFDREEWDQRRVERRVEREARRAEREAVREARKAEREARKRARRVKREVEEGVENEVCDCSARLSLSKPSLQWQNGVLMFQPRVDISIRSRGDERTPWTARVDYSGETSYESEDFTVPDGISFSDGKNVLSGYCGDDYRFSGLQLPSVKLTGLTRSLFSNKEMDGTLRMKTEVSGCGYEKEERSFKFSIKEFGNLRLKGWRSVR